MKLGADQSSGQVRIGIVGGGKGGSALLDLILAWPVGEVAVVVDPRPDAPALAIAKARGIPTATHHLDVFAYPVDLVLEVTGRSAVLNELLRAKPAGVEVIGAGSLRFFWDLLHDTITANRQLQVAQERLIQAERLRAFGQLASGLANDFNNMLTAILGRTQLLLRLEGIERSLMRQLRVIEQAALEGARTVQQIQDFTRTRSAHPHVRLDLGEILGEVRELTRTSWEHRSEAVGATHEIVIQAEPVPPIAGDPVELREAFTNLVLNALEAMPQGGQLRLTAAQEGDRARVTVEDTGRGMSPEVRRRAFEPFFTTKGTRGTGLGLSVVWGIVQRHRGEITLDSEEGKGTTFTLRFPVRADAVAEEAQVSRPWSPRRGKILIIDDEPEVRAVLREFLQAQGHTVVEAADGPTGLAEWEADGFDLVLTDIAMPGMSGWEVAEILKRRSHRPVGFITGWASQIEPAQLVASRVDFVLAKPFQLDEVLRCVAEALASGDESGSAHS
ncbi:MAG: response regulator [Candidatus Rokubacteria bacterium]|nr:response regulator [Candidatus Rokubacteria bacterium]